MKKILVVGGGMTGLAAAFLAARKGLEVTLLEAEDEIGGLLRTFEIGGGALECFYHHHFRADAEWAWLLSELGIGEKLQFHPTTMGVYREGLHYPFNGPLDLLKFAPMSFLDKVRFALTSLYVANGCDWRKCEGVTCAEFFQKYAGRTTWESLWKPMLAIKFGDFAEKVPLAWMVGRMRQRLNSRKGTRETLGYVDGSLRTVLAALRKKLAELGVQVLTHAPVRSLILREGRVCGVRAPIDSLEADAVLFTTPSDVVAELVREYDAAYARSLEQVEYFGALCVVLELAQGLSKTYWLNVADEGFPFGGVIEHTNLITPEHFGGRHIVYLSRYYERKNPLATRNEREIVADFIAGLRRLYPELRPGDILGRHLFQTSAAAVACDLDFSKKVPAFRAELPGLFLASMPQLYPDERSCNNSVRLAAEALAKMGLDMADVPRRASLAGILG